MLICWDCRNKDIFRHMKTWIKIALSGFLLQSFLQAAGSSVDHLEGYLWTKNMEALRGLISPTSSAFFCTLLDNMSDVLIPGLLRVIKGPKLTRPMAAHLQYEAFGSYKLVLENLWEKSVFFSWTCKSICLPCQVPFSLLKRYVSELKSQAVMFRTLQIFLWYRKDQSFPISRFSSWGI